MGEPSLMQSHRGILLRNKRSFWNTMHRVPDSVTLSAVTEPCTVADCGLRRVGGSGLGRYEGLFLPWFSWALPLMLPLPERTSTLGRLSLLPQNPQCSSTSVNYCVSSRFLSRGSDSVRTHQSFTSLSLIPYKLFLDFKTFNGQI